MRETQILFIKNKNKLLWMKIEKYLNQNVCFLVLEIAIVLSI